MPPDTRDSLNGCAVRDYPHVLPLHQQHSPRLARTSLMLSLAPHYSQAPRAGSLCLVVTLYVVRLSPSVLFPLSPHSAFRTSSPPYDVTILRVSRFLPTILKLFYQ
jgi:hypothetical protein